MNVTIATLSFNQAPFLERAILSVIDQTHAEVEYIVVDPGSTDGSRELISRYASRIDQVVLERDRGPSDGLNRALALASGDVFAWINADDALLPGAIEGAVRVLQSDVAVDAVYGQGYVVDEHDRVIRHFRSHPFDLRRYVYGGVNVMQQAFFVRRSALEAIGGFNVDNCSCWDGEALVELSLAGSRMRCVREYWGVFRLHGGSISGSGRHNALYELDRRRLFERAIGRPPIAADRLFRGMVRVGKWTSDPVGTVLRLRALGSRRGELTGWHQSA